MSTVLSNSQKSLGLATIAFFLLFFVYFSELVLIGGDSQTYLDRTITIRSGSEEGIPTHFSRLYSIIGEPFSYGERYWKFLALLIFGGLIPLLLMFITRSGFAPFFYYMVENYYFKGFEQGFLAEGLLIVFLLAILYERGPLKQLLLVGVGALSHSWAVVILPLTLFSKNFSYVIQNYYNKITVNLTSERFTNLFNRKKVMYYFLFLFAIKNGLSTNYEQGIVVAFGILLLGVAFESFLENKQYHLILLSIFSIIAGLFIEGRAFSLVGLLIVIGITQKFSIQSNKKTWLIFFVLIGFLNFYQWLNHVNVPIDFKIWSQTIPLFHGWI